MDLAVLQHRLPAAAPVRLPVLAHSGHLTVRLAKSQDVLNGSRRKLAGVEAFGSAFSRASRCSFRPLSASSTGLQVAAAAASAAAAAAITLGAIRRQRSAGRRHVQFLRRTCFLAGPKRSHSALRATSSRIPRNAEREGDEDVPGVMRRPVNARSRIDDGGELIPDPDEPDWEESPEAIEARKTRDAIYKQRFREAIIANVEGSWAGLDGAAPGLEVAPSQGIRPAGRFAVWVLRRKDLPELLRSWAVRAAERTASEAVSTGATGVAESKNLVGTPEELQSRLEALAAQELPASWAVWALADPSRVPSGPGFYMAGPTKPQALVVLESPDQGTSNIQHVAADPAELGPAIRAAVQDWIESLRPKNTVICRPDEFRLFGLEVLASGSKGAGGAAGGAKVSRGI